VLEINRKVDKLILKNGKMTFKRAKMTRLFTLFALVLVGLASAQVPIPNRPDGWGVGGPADSHVVIEMFLDPLCPDCKATWPILQQVVQAYGTRIHFRFHTFPLPYHTNAFLVSQSIHVVANYTSRNSNAIFEYTTKIFENQAQWYNGATSNLTMPQVAESVATFAASTGLIPKDKVLDGLTNDDLNFETRVSWKYTCSRGATGTPTFLINGVAVGADDTWALKDWQSVIDPILAVNAKQTTDVADCPSDKKTCEYLPGKIQCCLPGENCIANVGCRCFNLRNGNKCF